MVGVYILILEISLGRLSRLPASKSSAPPKASIFKFSKAFFQWAEKGKRNPTQRVVVQVKGVWDKILKFKKPKFNRHYWQVRPTLCTNECRSQTIQLHEDLDKFKLEIEADVKAVKTVYMKNKNTEHFLLLRLRNFLKAYLDIFKDASGP